MQAGADGYLLKHAERFDLCASVRAVARGGSILDPVWTTGERAPALTARELQLLQLVAEGLTNRQIGDRLHLSHHTVKEQLSAAMAKLGAKNRAEAALAAARRGLL